MSGALEGESGDFGEIGIGTEAVNVSPGVIHTFRNLDDRNRPITSVFRMESNNGWSFQNGFHPVPPLDLDPVR
jgi:hypothetical protein